MSALEYIERKHLKEAAIMAMGNLGRQMLTYKEILKESIVRLRPTGDEVEKALPATSLYSNGDGRSGLAIVRSDLHNRLNISFSFLPEINKCYVCPKEHRQSNLPQLLVLTDQSYPAAATTSSEIDCPKIVRVENGRIANLVDTLLQHIRTRPRPGSVIALYSQTELGLGGAANFLFELLKAANKIKRKLGDEYTICIAPPITMENLVDFVVIKQILTVYQWLRATDDPNAKLLMSAWDTACSDIRKLDFESDGELVRAALPVSLNANAEVRFFSLRLMPTDEIWPACSRITEEKIWQAVASDIEQKTTVRIANVFQLSRDPVKGLPEGSRSIAVAGGRAAEALVEYMNIDGENIVKVCDRNWEATATRIEYMRSKLAEGLQHIKAGTIVLHLLQDEVFVGRASDGSILKPKLDEDGLPHISGDLSVIDNRACSNILDQLLPIINEAAGRNLIIVAPTPIFVDKPCCDSNEHVTNRSRIDFLLEQKKGLATVLDTIRAFIKAKGLALTRALDPEQSLKCLSIEETWGGHPIALTPRANELIVEGIRTVDSTITRCSISNRAKELAKSSAGGSRTRHAGSGSHSHADTDTRRHRHASNRSEDERRLTGHPRQSHHDRRERTDPGDSSRRYSRDYTDGFEVYEEYRLRDRSPRSSRSRNPDSNYTDYRYTSDSYRRY
jgi:hypothetical protein